MATPKPPPPLQYTPRSHIHIFISTLHLLDLARQPTYPDITLSTFSATSTLQQRIKATEWSLYHLFQLYYHHLHSSSPSIPSQIHLLTPTFSFPPKTPLHSLTLRSGFYKILTDMKRTAILPKSITLRKTMFDECKGEKFDEVLAAFAMVVLRVVVLSSTDKESRPLSSSSSNVKSASTSKMIRAPSTRSKPTSHIKKPSSSTVPLKAPLPIPSLPSIKLSAPPSTGTTTNPDHIVPLLLAHRVILQRNLEHRQKLAQQAQTYSSYFDARENTLKHQLQELESHSNSLHSPGESSSSSSPSENDLAELRDRVMRAFATLPEWGRYLFEGESGSEDLIAGRDESEDKLDRFRLESDGTRSSSFPILRPPESILSIEQDQQDPQDQQQQKDVGTTRQNNPDTPLTNLKARILAQVKRIQVLQQAVHADLSRTEDTGTKVEADALLGGRDMVRSNTNKMTTPREVAQPRFTRHLSIRV